MLTNETRRNILDRVKSSGYPGGVSEAFSAAEQGIDVVDQFVQQQQQEQAQQQAQGQQIQEDAQAPPPPPSSNTPDRRVSAPNINNPINNNQEHLVQAGDKQNVGIQALPTGSAQGQVIQAESGGFKKLYPDGGFHFNPADFDPNYDQGSVQDNTQINNFQENQSNFAEKEALLAKIAKDKKYAETQALIKKQKGTLIDTTKRNMSNMLGNSFLAGQTDGGYGGQNIQKDLAAAQQDGTFKERFNNAKSYTGTNTMQNIAMGVTGVGASNLVKSGTSNLGTRILSYPTDKLASSLQATISQPGFKNFAGNALKSSYNYGLMTGVPKVLSDVTTAGANYASGQQTGLGAFADASLATANFVPAIKNFNKLGPIATNYSKIKNLAKGAKDVSEGNYLTALTRQFGNSNKDIIKYGSKLGKNFIPQSFENQIGIRTATGGPSLFDNTLFRKTSQLKTGGTRYTRRRMGYVNKNIL